MRTRNDRRIGMIVYSFVWYMTNDSMGKLGEADMTEENIRQTEENIRQTTLEEFGFTFTKERASLGDRLPVLSEEERSWTKGSTQKDWVYSHLSCGIGYVWTMPDQGMSLQVISDDTIRLLTVVDHEWCLFMVACVMAALDNLGLKLDLSVAIVAPTSSAIIGGR